VSYFYLDTSAVVKRYGKEIGSDWIRGLIDPIANHAVILGEITLVEVAATLAAKHRAPRGISRNERDEALSLFLRHCRTEYELMATSRPIIDQAVDLTQNHRLRGYDAVQLATAIVANEIFLRDGLSPLTFVTADNDLLTAANAEGLMAENPNLH